MLWCHWCGGFDVIGVVVVVGLVDVFFITLSKSAKS